MEDVHVASAGSDDALVPSEVTQTNGTSGDAAADLCNLRVRLKRWISKHQAFPDPFWGHKRMDKK